MKNPILLFTRALRTSQALKYIAPKAVHVDIGCGIKQYLLNKSPCEQKIGFDMQLNHTLKKNIPLESRSVDYITMLAVIEHLDYPLEIIHECSRVLKQDGILILTTPKASGLWIMKLISPGFERTEGSHKQHYNYNKMQRLVKGYFEIIVFKVFCFGFNQIFVLKKIKS